MNLNEGLAWAMNKIDKVKAILDDRYFEFNRMLQIAALRAAQKFLKAEEKLLMDEHEREQQKGAQNDLVDRRHDGNQYN